MTILVGILCADGVVVGSDSSATFSAGPRLQTIEQPVRKTFTVGTDVILATTGAGGLGQRFEFVLHELRHRLPDWHERHHLPLAVQVCREMLQHLQQTFLGPGQIGALVAFACQDGFHLCEFATTDFQPELKTEDTWFVSMGSGQMITDPFFGMLRRTLFRESRPTLDEAVVLTVWALHNAIELNVGGINGPMQLGVLRRPAPDAPAQARLIPSNELKEHVAALARVEGYLAGARQHLLPPPAETGPSPAPPARTGADRDQT
jgi:20S proteasome alpha/beta subunit